MSEKIRPEMIKGSAVTLVLTTLERRAQYGYELIKSLETSSKNVFSLSEGALYPILHKLEQDGAVTSYWEEREGRQRKYYEITRSGRMLLKEKKKEWALFKTAIDQVLSAEFIFGLTHEQQT